MAERRAPAAKTTLAFGLVKVPVALLKMTQAPTDVKYETAGPNGHPLHTETRLFRGDEMIEQPEQEIAAAVEQHDEAAVAAVEDPGPEAPPASDPLDPDAAAAAFADAADLNRPEQRQVLVEAETGEVVPKDEIRRGLREGSEFIDLTAGLAAIDEATKLEQMGVVAFIDVGQVPRELVRDSHYLCADGQEARLALAYLYNGMREARRAAVVKWTKREKQALGVVVANGRTGALEVLEMAWPNHVRDAKSDPRILGHAGFESPENVKAAVGALIDAMSVTREGSFERQRDDRETMRAELLEKVRAGETFAVPAEPEPEKAEATVEEMFVESGERKDELAKAA